MTRSELAKNVAAACPHLYQKDVEAIVSTIFNEITQALAKGKRIEIRGFGVFSTRIRKARIGRNPKAGTAVKIPEKRVPCFKTGKKLAELLNEK